MLSLVDMGNNGPSPSDQDTDSLVSSIGFIFGGEQAARTYMQRLASRNQRLKESATKQQPTPNSTENSSFYQGQFRGVIDDSTANASAVETPMEYMGETQPMGVHQMNLVMDDVVLQNLLNFDMTALMTDSQYG
jgi:hypothetical protein